MCLKIVVETSDETISSLKIVLETSYETISSLKIVVGNIIWNF